MKRIVLFFVVTLSLWAMPSSDPRPGGVVIEPLPSNLTVTSVRFVNREGIVFFGEGRWWALAPIPLDVGMGTYSLRFYRRGKEVWRKLVKVRDYRYPQQHLRIKNRRKVTPNPADIRRIRKEAPRKRRAKAFHSDRNPDLNFIWPVQGRISSLFGLHRFFNGKPRAPHRGIDIAAKEGRPVRAVADGVVADAGNFFFSGNLLFLEHGKGVMTLYAHLSRYVVKPGERVKKGQIIGYVGHTGRATGPHLHFGVLIRGVYVDPMIFLPDKRPKKR